LRLLHIRKDSWAFPSCDLETRNDFVMAWIMVQRLTLESGKANEAANYIVQYFKEAIRAGVLTIGFIDLSLCLRQKQCHKSKLQIRSSNETPIRCSSQEGWLELSMAYLT